MNLHPYLAMEHARARQEQLLEDAQRLRHTSQADRPRGGRLHRLRHPRRRSPKSPITASAGTTGPTETTPATADHALTSGVRSEEAPCMSESTR